MKKVQVVALVATVQQNSVGRNKIKIQSDNDHNSWSEMNRTQQNTPVPGRAEPSRVALEETSSLRGENKQTVKQIFRGRPRTVMQAVAQQGAPLTPSEPIVVLMSCRVQRVSLASHRRDA